MGSAIAAFECDSVNSSSDVVVVSLRRSYIYYTSSCSKLHDVGNGTAISTRRSGTTRAIRHMI
jgi:hypothetical protein